jgi:hypothetical protein
MNLYDLLGLDGEDFSKDFFQNVYLNPELENLVGNKTCLIYLPSIIR